MFTCNTKAQTEEQTTYNTSVGGTFTTGEGYDASDDLKDVGIVIVDRSTEPVDTLYKAVTNENGSFEGRATFSRNGEYPILVTKGSERLGDFTLVLAQGDDVHIEAALPNLSETITIHSIENEALRTYRRLDNQFYRIINLINAGAVEEAEIPVQINTWVDLFWSVRTDYPNTVAADRAANKALETLEGWDDQKTLDLLNSDPDDENLREAAIYYGTIAKLNLDGLDSSINYLDELDEKTSDEANRRLIAMNKIELLYDSLRVEQARQVFNENESMFEDNMDSSWAASMGYELNYLAPGMPVPDFELETNDQGTISNTSLRGNQYLLEIVELANRQYQNYHPAVSELVESYSDSGLRLITVPLEHSAITINAFYDERPKPWAVAISRAYEESELIEKFNINQLPSRILIDADGNIVKKYIGNNLQDLEADIETSIK
ncbi:MAG: thioredoxin-like domain-containing protein [Balneolales bacterium]